jgi:hypothetical protein
VEGMLDVSYNNIYKDKEGTYGMCDLKLRRSSSSKWTDIDAKSSFVI